MSSKIFVLSTTLLASSTLLLGACRPEVDEPATEIKDPAKDIGPAKKKADQEAKKDKDKSERSDKLARKKTREKKKTPALAPGAKAPDFTLTDLGGKDVSLSSFAGKTVVLEWFNPDCPFVVYARRRGTAARDGEGLRGQGARLARHQLRS